MTEWLNVSVLLSSALGSLVAGLILLTTTPFWWKWAKKWANTEAASRRIKAWLPFLAFAIILAALFFGMNYFERSVEKSNIPPFHPSLTEEEAAAARSECKMRAIEATATLDIYGRHRAAAQYYGACLESKGFEWNEPQPVSP